MKWLLAFAAVAACSKSPEPEVRRSAISADEIQRAVEACTAYVDKLCACASEQAKTECKVARALPDSIQVAKSLATNPKAEAEDSGQAASSIRKTAKHCIDATVRLPDLGCP